MFHNRGVIRWRELDECRAFLNAVEFFLDPQRLIPWPKGFYSDRIRQYGNDGDAFDIDRWQRKSIFRGSIVSGEPHPRFQKRSTCNGGDIDLLLNESLVEGLNDDFVVIHIIIIVSFLGKVLL